MRVFSSIRNRTYEFFYQLLLLPKNIWFNFHLLPVKQAVKLPLFVNYGVKIKKMQKDIVEIRSRRIQRGMISIGRGGSEEIPVSGAGMVSLDPHAKIIFEGPAQFHAGVRLWLDGQARVRFGSGFSANRNFLLFYNDQICFGRDCMLGWNIQIIDGNSHTLTEGGKKKKAHCRITVGDHVWIGAETKICRSVSIGRDSVVAYGSTITGGHFPAHSLIGGYPATRIKGGVNWIK